MMKSPLSLMLFLILFGNTLFATEKYDVKSFRVITKLCGKCHGIPFHLAKQKDEDEWDEYFEDDQNLLKLHQKEPEALSNLKSKKFKYFRQKILKFFIDNSKYAGRVHGCDANFCGAHY
ncbi:MAG: hypothetical protein ACP5D3_00235 [Sulfurovum sp.]